LVIIGELVDHRLRQVNGRGLIIGKQRQNRLREACEVPLRHGGLIAVGVPTALIDEAIHRLRVIGIHEGTGAEIQRLTSERHVVRIHNAVNEAQVHPARHQLRLALHEAAEQFEIRRLHGPAVGVMTLDRVIGQGPDTVDVIASGEILEGTNTHVPGCNARQHRSRRDGLPHYRVAGQGQR